MPEEPREQIRAGLIGWYRENARDLPWRRTRDPYAILVSEVMLQQTQVDRVLPYYERFLERFPTVHELASAATAEVIRLWAGLGYNRRAVNLQRAARTVVEQFNGVFPDTVEALRALPGVGAYTAGAIAAFAYDQDVTFLDTNMRRVITRVLFGAENGDGNVSEADVQEAARHLLPPHMGWEWNQALIEFGALQCTSRRPACIVCPLQQKCLAFPAMQNAMSAKRARTRLAAPEPFETTTRYYRGRIVDALRDLPEQGSGIGLTELGAHVREGFAPEDLPWLRGLVEGLQRDGLAVLSEESPPYDAAESIDGSPRVRLP
jgi:A/G-specific adenine glycosylase